MPTDIDLTGYGYAMAERYCNRQCAAWIFCFLAAEGIALSRSGGHSWLRILHVVQTSGILTVYADVRMQVLQFSAEVELFWVRLFQLSGYMPLKMRYEQKRRKSFGTCLFLYVSSDCSRPTFAADVVPRVAIIA